MRVLPSVLLLLTSARRRQTTVLKSATKRHVLQKTATNGTESHQHQLTHQSSQLHQPNLVSAMFLPANQSVDTLLLKSNATTIHTSLLEVKSFGSILLPTHLLHAQSTAIIKLSRHATKLAISSTTLACQSTPISARVFQD